MAGGSMGGTTSSRPVTGADLAGLGLSAAKGQVRVKRPAPKTASKAGVPAGKAALISDSGVRLILPFAPREVDHGGWADRWDTIDRPQRRPLVRHAGDGLPTMSFDVLLARWDHQQPVEDYIAKLRNLAVGESRVTVLGMGINETGPWQLTGVQVKTLLRQEGTNAITRAVASLDFTLAVDVVVAGVKKPPAKKGPASGGSKRTAPKGKGSSTAKAYTVKKGDSLQKIADTFYGDPNEWPRIANANPKHARVPRWLAPGMVLTIPPKVGPTGTAGRRSTAKVRAKK